MQKPSLIWLPNTGDAAVQIILTLGPEKAGGIVGVHPPATLAKPGACGPLWRQEEVGMWYYICFPVLGRLLGGRSAPYVRGKV